LDDCNNGGTGGCNEVNGVNGAVGSGKAELANREDVLNDDERGRDGGGGGGGGSRLSPVTLND
jgi:hypothetical protein